jgi:carboxyl-terminal processing protease
MENQPNSENKLSWTRLFVVSLAFFLAGFYFGNASPSYLEKIAGVEGKEKPQDVTTDFSSFWKVWHLIDEKYVPPQLKEETVTGQEKVWGAIKGLVHSLEDPNTVFLVPSELEIFEREIGGNFEGVGMEIDVRDGMLTVIAPLKGTPAYKAGIKAGDIIFKIDEQETVDLTVDQSVNLIRGKKGTPVILTLFRENIAEPIIITIIRDVIDIPTIDTEWIDGVFVMRLYNFSAIAPELFRKSLREFASSGGNKMILDLRGNPGGFLEASVDITSWFLPAGKIIVKEDFGGKEEDTVYRSRGYNIFGKNLKMAVLIDGGSASASEILAGALREHGVATLIGSQSFGKGSVQELVKVTSDTSLKVTVARWVTPEGHSISLEGLTPDIVIEPEAENSDGKDAVLEKALEIVRR